MNDNIVTLPRMDLCFGNCPRCHKTHRCYSVGPDHWCVCHTHRTKWLIGSNLFSCWKDMSKQCFLRNEYMLAGYREVEPWLPDDVQERLEREFERNSPTLLNANARSERLGAGWDSRSALQSERIAHRIRNGRNLIKDGGRHGDVAHIVGRHRHFDEGVDFVHGSGEGRQ